MNEKKSLGIIAEYNPFHNGHLYHIEESVKMTGAEVVVAAMSGNFVQRGNMPVADKWDRAEAAVKNGVDLVVEIPTVFACNSAPYFANAAVKILENLGVTWISFGSESGNIENLSHIARVISEGNTEIEDIIREKVKSGLAYPRARKEALVGILNNEYSEMLDLPNNILAIEYLRNIDKAEPITVKRKGSGYNDIEIYDNIASATAIRYMINHGKAVNSFIPETVYELLKRGNSPSEHIIFKMICQNVLSKTAEELDSVSAGGEGLGNKIKKAIRNVSSYEALAEQLKSKRYTRTRIDRFLMHVLLDIKKYDNYCNYIRVLAFNEKGSTYLKKIKKSEICQLPIITNINKDLLNCEYILPAIEKDILATDLYNLATERDLYLNSEYVNMPRKIL